MRKFNQLELYLCTLLGRHLLGDALMLLEMTSDDTPEFPTRKPNGQEVPGKPNMEARQYVEWMHFPCFETAIRVGVRIESAVSAAQSGTLDAGLKLDGFDGIHFGRALASAKPELTGDRLDKLMRIIDDHENTLPVGGSKEKIALVPGGKKQYGVTHFQTVAEWEPHYFDVVMDSIPALAKKVRQQAAFARFIELLEAQDVATPEDVTAQPPPPEMSMAGSSGLTAPPVDFPDEPPAAEVAINSWFATAVRDELCALLQDLGVFNYGRVDFEDTPKFVPWMRRLRFLVRMNLAVSFACASLRAGNEPQDLELPWDWAAELTSRSLATGKLQIGVQLKDFDTGATTPMLDVPGPWSQTGPDPVSAMPAGLTELPELLRKLVKARLDELEALNMPFPKKVARAADIGKAAALMRKAQAAVFAAQWWPELERQLEL